MIEQKYLIKNQPPTTSMDKKAHALCLLCCLLRVHSKYSNRAITLIQQSACLISTLMAPHSLCYNKKTKQTTILKIINFKRKWGSKR